MSQGLHYIWEKNSKRYIYISEIVWWLKDKCIVEKLLASARR